MAIFIFHKHFNGRIWINLLGKVLDIYDKSLIYYPTTLVQNVHMIIHRHYSISIQRVFYLSLTSKTLWVKKGYIAFIDNCFCRYAICLHFWAYGCMKILPMRHSRGKTTQGDDNDYGGINIIFFHKIVLDGFGILLAYRDVFLFSFHQKHQQQ